MQSNAPVASMSTTYNSNSTKAGSYDKKQDSFLAEKNSSAKDPSEVEGDAML